jgi:adenylate cyclase
MDAGEIRFGRFRLDLKGRQVWRDSRPVRLGGRAFDLLCVLACAMGNVISKDEIIAQLWPGRAVEEGNLHFQISTLRRALAEDGDGHSYVVTVPGRGYRLAGLSGSELTGLEQPAGPTLPLPDKPSIAVLPFRNLSGDQEQEYFADGIVEEIITALSRIRWLFVIARNSTFTYKGKTIDLKRIGRELGVRYVLEGSVRKDDGRVRITAQLIEPETGAHLWAERFDGSVEDVFSLQDQIASSVAGVIEPALQAAETVRSVNRPTNDLTAYDLYLRAYAMVMASVGQATEALYLLEQAISRDPSYGPALAWAAVCCLRLVFDGRSVEPVADSLKGIDFARRALKAANDDPSTLANAAQVLAYFDEDISTMMALVDRALAFNPNYARGWHISGTLRLWAGLPEIAIEHMEIALRLSPRARIGLSLAAIGRAHLLTRRFVEAIPKLLLAIQEDPSFPNPYCSLAVCYAHMGRIDDARGIIARLRAVTSAAMPDVTGDIAHFRNPDHRELLLSGLRLAMGKTV